MKKENFSIIVNSPLDSEYIQKLAFKAGYTWCSGNDNIIHTDKPKLNFKGRYVEHSPRDYIPMGIKITYSFPKDAEKIHEIFTTPEPVEYKVGDYVVLVDSGLWSMVLEKIKGSTQKIKSIPKDSEINEYCLPHSIIFEEKSLKRWCFNLKDIARHATDDEIKKYKEGDDIYIGEHKVEFFHKHDLNNGIKVGCINLNDSLLKAIKLIFDYTRDVGGTFMINKNNIVFYDGHISLDKGVTYFPDGGKNHKVSAEQFNKIIKKAGIE